MDIHTLVEEIMKDTAAVAIGCDHGGYDIKCQLVEFLKSKGKTVNDVGTHSTDSVDYPEYALKVAREVALKKADFGIMIDGAGVGSAITCNKVKGIRAAHCSNTFEAYNARAHNNANVLTLGSRVIGIELLKFIVTTFLETPFEGGRHEKRVNLITEIENDLRNRER